MRMYEFKHDISKIIEACAKTLQNKLGFNIYQVMRHFQVFSMDYFNNTPFVPDEERENWYYLRETRSHASLIFNFETEEIKFIDFEYKWKDNEFVNDFQKSEEQLSKENDKYLERMEKIQLSFVYKNLKSIIEWYFSCPDISISRDILPTPKKFVLMLLEKNLEWLKLNEHENLILLRDSLLEAYHYEERNKK